MVTKHISEKQPLLIMVAIISFLPKHLKSFGGSQNHIILCSQRQCWQLSATDIPLDAGEPLSGNITAYVPLNLFSI